MSEIVWDSIKQNGREREGGRVRELFFFFGCVHLSREYMLSSVY